MLLKGLGGFGKSTLAGRVARILADKPYKRFKTVVWSSAYLRPDWGLDIMVDDFSALVPEIGQRPTRAEKEAMALAYLQAVPTLLICDNVETLTNPQEQNRLAGFIEQVNPAGGSRVLLTTRIEDPWLHKVLNKPGGVRLPELGGLDEPAAIELLRKLSPEKGLAALAQDNDAALSPLVNAVHRNPYMIEILLGLGDIVRIRETPARLPTDLRHAQDALLADAFARLRATPGALELVQQVGVFVPSADFAALRDVAGANLPRGAYFDDALTPPALPPSSPAPLIPTARSATASTPWSRAPWMPQMPSARPPPCSPPPAALMLLTSPDSRRNIGT
jgi:hypothetical protein